MVRLVADLGGTNCRLAQITDPKTCAGSAPQAIQSYRIDGFNDFASLVRRYLEDSGQTDLSEMVIAVAGPVSDCRLAGSGQIAKVTNWDWQISSTELGQAFGDIPVGIINDLNALGHSLTDLKSGDLQALHPPELAQDYAQDDGLGQQQRLVIGIGTGFNLSPVITTQQGVTCLAGEYGHVSLPQDVHLALAARLGGRADQFRSVECCFSGRGCEALFAAFTPQSTLKGAADILHLAPQAETKAFQEFYANLLALLCRNLLKGFLPREGIYFAGSIARSLLTGPASARFASQFFEPDPQFPDIAAPVYILLDDAAALKGCARYRFSPVEVQG